MNTLIQVSKELTILSLNITIFLILKMALHFFIHDCIECQRKKQFNMKIQTAPTQSFSEHAPSSNYWIFLDIKRTYNPPAQHKSYIHLVIDAFSHFVVTIPIKSNNAETAMKTLLHHRIIKFGPPIYLVTVRGSEYVNNEMAQLCTLMGIDIPPEHPFLFGQMVLYKYKIENFVLISPSKHS